jgi:hypothetical protein
MLKWLIAIFLCLVLLSALRPWLARLGVGRLPGDWRFRFAGREIYLPFASTVVLSLLVTGLMQVL